MLLYYKLIQNNNRIQKRMQLLMSIIFSYEWFVEFIIIHYYLVRNYIELSAIVFEEKIG